MILKFEADQGLTLIATNVSAVSIVIVYHMFALQSWLEIASELRDRALEVSLVEAPDSYLRNLAKMRLGNHVKRFPWSQVVILGAAVGAMVSTGIYVGRGLPPDIRWIADGPLLVLGLVYLFSTLTVFLKGWAASREGRGFLGVA